MAFAYYRRLNKKDRCTYDRSDATTALALRRPARLRALVHHLHSALASGDRVEVLRTSRSLADALCENLGIPRARIVVRAARPADDGAELHGLYTPARGRRLACIEVWMRTARRRQVVAFRTYLRTLLHELGHHIDLELLGLDESFHTEGFYKRESSLFHQIVDGTGL